MSSQCYNFGISYFNKLMLAKRDFDIFEHFLVNDFCAGTSPEGTGHGMRLCGLRFPLVQPVLSRHARTIQHIVGA